MADPSSSLAVVDWDRVSILTAGSLADSAEYGGGCRAESGSGADSAERAGLAGEGWQGRKA